MHLGKRLSEYNLSCSPKQGAKHNTHAVDSQVDLSHGHSSLGLYSRHCKVSLS